MKDRKHYISLRFKGGNAFHQNGKRLVLTDRIVNIGETQDCDIRYETDYQQAEYYASIVRNEDGESWRIVKRSQYVDISIEGKGTIGYAHVLKDGDIIRFEGQTMALSFQTHYDNLYEEGNQNIVWQWVAAGILVLATVLSIAVGFSRKQEGISASDVSALEESICLLKVDSVCRVHIINGEEVTNSPMRLFAGEAPTGTAFLTTDGRLVTARHCVEYWLGINLDLTTKVADLGENDIVRWAIETESFNQTHDGDSVMRLKVFFTVFDFTGNKLCSFASTDRRVHINTDNDGIFLLADFSDDYFWRSIRPYFTERSMELGDILWIDSFPQKGKVRLADGKQLEKARKGTKLMICGYPETGLGDRHMTFTEGTIRREVSVDHENLFFESNINHGFSGGPVLMKLGSEVVAIGVVSRVDSVSSGLYKWAVPISEVGKECLNTEGNER